MTGVLVSPNPPNYWRLSLMHEGGLCLSLALADMTRDELTCTEYLWDNCNETVTDNAVQGECPIMQSVLCACMGTWGVDVVLSGLSGNGKPYASAGRIIV